MAQGPTTNSIDPLIDQVIEGRYHVRMQIGVGAMGAVYLAEHTMMGNTVAIKILHPDQSKNEESVARFQREAQTASTINHPNICAATDFGRLDSGAFFLVMEFLEGDTLRQAIRADAPLLPSRAIHIITQLASALASAHDQGIVHRDLKPANVMLVERAGDKDFVKLTDFGLAGLSDIQDEDQVRLTMAGVVYGTPAYLSPEQASAEYAIDGRADLYALGGIFFEMLTGRLPFLGGNVTQMLTAHLTQEPPRASDFNLTHYIPPELDAIIIRLLAKKPHDRFQSAADLITALESLDLESHPETTRVTAQGPPPKPLIPSAEEITTPRGAPPAAPAPAAEAIATPPRAAQKKPYSTTIKILAAAIPVAFILVIALAALAISTCSDDAPPIPTDPEELADYHITQTTRELAAERDKVVEKLDAMRPVLDHLAGGEHEEAITALEGIEKKEAAGPHYFYYMGMAYGAGEREVESLDAFGEAIEMEPRYAFDKRLIESALDALSSRDEETEAKAKEILEGPLLETATFPLARMAYDPGSNRGRKRARAILDESGKFDTLPSWRQNAIRLRLDIGCKPRGAAVEALGEADTPLALGPLREYDRKSRRGCGKRKREDCYGCIRDEIAAAITKLEAKFPEAVESPDMGGDMNPDMESNTSADAQSDDGE